MNFHRHSKGRERRISLVFWGLLILALGILVLNTLTNQSISKALRKVAAPIWSVESKVASTPLISYFSSKSALSKKVMELESKLNKSEIDLLSYPIILEENKELKLLLGRVSSDTRLLAAVLVPPYRNKYDTLIIDVGKNQPISKGNLVVAHPDIPIGTIEALNNDTALVSLFSNPGRETEATFGEDWSLTLIGAGAGNFKVEVPRATPISIGDVVKLPALYSRIVGVVGNINVRPTDAFQTILINSPINIFSLRFVEVIVEN